MPILRQLREKNYELEARLGYYIVVYMCIYVYVCTIYTHILHICNYVMCIQILSK